MDLIFHGPLGLELSLDRSTGVARVKAAEKDSPAQLVVGRALTAIEGVPVGEIRDKKSWLAVVAKLQAPERPLSLTFEAPAVSPEEPAQPVQRARAELDALAASAKVAAEQAEAEAAAVASAPAPTRGRAFSCGGPRSRSPSPELTCSQCGRTGKRADGFFRALVGHNFCSEACQAKSPTRLDLERADRITRADRERASKLGTHPLGSSARRRLPRSRSRSRSPRRRRESSPPRRNCHDTAPPRRPRPPSPPGLGQRPTRRHLIAAAESARALQPAVESEPAARGPSDEGQRGPMPSLARDAPAAPPVPREAPVGLCPPDDVIRQRLVERQVAKLQRDFRRSDAIQADLARAGVHISDVAAQMKGLVHWTTTDGRSGPKPPSESEIYDMVLAFERAKFIGHKPPEGFQQMMAEMAVSGVAKEHLDRSGRTYGRGALRWLTIDGRTGPPKMSEREIEARLREWVRAREDNNRLSHELRADLAARGVRVEPGQGWYTAGPNGLSGPIPSLDRNRSRSRSRSPRRRRGSSRSRSRSRSRKRSRKQSKSHKAAAPPAAPGLDEQRPTRRHLVAAAPSEASSSDGS